MTTIQVSNTLHNELIKRKLFDRETYEEVIWDLIEDTRELNDQKRIIPTLEQIKIRPQAHVTKLVGDLGYRLRVGDHRVILDIDEGNLIILVIKIGHRKKIYK